MTIKETRKSFTKRLIPFFSMKDIEKLEEFGKDSYRACFEEEPMKEDPMVYDFMLGLLWDDMENYEMFNKEFSIILGHEMDIDTFEDFSENAILFD